MSSSIPFSSSSITSAASAFLRPLLLLIIAVAFVPCSLGAQDTSNDADVEPAVEITSISDATKSVTLLNRFSFNNAVQQEHVDHWIVLFCAEWYELCKEVQPGFQSTATVWEEALSYNATSWQKSAVRFGEVSCATDKALCNENNVETYPTVLHFKGGELVESWELTQSLYDNGMAVVSAHLFTWIGDALTGELRTDGKWSEQAPEEHAQGDLIITKHLEELFNLLSLSGQKDPMVLLHQVFGYFVMAVAIGSFAWTVGSGLELDLKAALSGYCEQAKTKRWSSSLLPSLPELPASRTIVRRSLEL